MPIDRCIFNKKEGSPADGTNMCSLIRAAFILILGAAVFFDDEYCQDLLPRANLLRWMKTYVSQKMLEICLKLFTTF